jgi:hypothetical protein
MGEARKLLPSEKTRLPDIVVGRRILGHGAQLQAKRLAAKAKANQ